ncbi:hypothetical protein H9Q13_00185 [Pontibacter sp. JH31]|uniref:Uncharacterized protein n=1 Tax=Pontibacter aquaedesilientis TaxID=2766980 RepID=A0ABR7XB86_9BACT|nr:hypothetical protein [Pontibacter aquaedesilientis]MBD1395569.1 hypothetical protein [Pontibacter aquaedesilientis]
MIKSLKLASAIIGATLLFTSCKDCDTTVIQVADDEAEWLVYDRNDSVTFINEKAEEVLFVNTLLNAQQVPGEGFNVSDDCIERYDMQAMSIIQNTQRSYPGLATYFLKRPDTFEVILLVENQGEYTIDETQPTYPSLDVNNTLYTNVFEVTNPDGSKATNMKRLLFNKEFGFISVEYYDGKKLELKS